jgi:23S rRNA G2069 N7-methylase RlmK/C1962 C5-methylase RlmI
MSIIPVDPFSEAWRLLRPLQIFPVNPSEMFTPRPGESVEALTVKRVEREVQTFLKTLHHHLDHSFSKQKGAEQLHKALKSIQQWKKQSKPLSFWRFQWRQWQFKNWVLDMKDAQHIWQEELRQWAIWRQAIGWMEKGIQQAQQHPSLSSSTSLRASEYALMLFQDQLTKRYHQELQWLKESQQLIVLREELMKIEDAKHAQDVLNRWHLEDQ